MELDDAGAMAALLATAGAVLEERVRPALAGDARLEAAMIASAVGLAARALAARGTAWSARHRGLEPAAPVATRVAALRGHVEARLAVTRPGYAAEVAAAPP